MKAKLLVYFFIYESEIVVTNSGAIFTVFGPSLTKHHSRPKVNSLKGLLWNTTTDQTQLVKAPVVAL